MVVVNNQHPRIRVAKKPLIELAQRICKEEGFFGEISITLVDDPFIASLNSRYHKTAGPTDVLSFYIDGRPVLGDIYISLDTARRQAPLFGNRFREEVRLLVAHGVLHLCGFDDSTEKERALMKAREVYYLR